MKIFNVIVPYDIVIEERSGVRSRINLYNSIPEGNSTTRNIANDSAVNSFINGLVTADLSENKYVDEISLRSGENAIYFKLKEPIIPIMAIRENRKYIFDDALRKKLADYDSHLLVTHLKMAVPNSVDNELRVWAWNDNVRELSDHPNSGDDHICYGTYRDRMKIGRVQISKLIDLLRIANLDSAYRNFRYDINWSKIPNEVY